LTDPLVSIVIPCYNAEAYVAEAIQSALDQTYSHTEVIVVDDGSTDGSVDVIRSFGDSIRYLTGPNAGAAAARNKGTAVAQGELLQFLDADDLLYPQKLQRQVPLAQAARPGMVFCDADVVNMKTTLFHGRWGTGSVSTEDAVVHALLVIIQTSGPLHWKETFHRVGGFREHLRVFEDPDLHLRLACAGVSFDHLPECLYVMRRVPDCLTMQDPSNGLFMQRQVGEDAYSDLSNRDQLTPARRAAFAGFFAATGRRALRLRLSSLAMECFARAREIHSDGGLPQAYSQPMRTVARMLGPRVTEKVIGWKRTLFRNRELA